MKANEVRLGNYYDRNGEIAKISPNDILDLWNSDRQWIKPVELTCEWLERFGFKKKGFLTYYKELLSISMPSEDPLLWRNGRTYFNSWKILDAPRYVHQLQNIYFALANEELTLNP